MCARARAAKAEKRVREANTTQAAAVSDVLASRGLLKGRARRKLWWAGRWLKRKYGRKRGVQLLVRSPGKSARGRWMAYTDVLDLAYGTQCMGPISANGFRSEV